MHVLEHIQNDVGEIKEVFKKLNRNGHLIIMVPAHQKLYSKFDKSIGHYRRYEREFFKTELEGLKRVKLLSLDSMGLMLDK